VLTLLADNWQSGTTATAVVRVKLGRVESSSVVVRSLRWRQQWRRPVWRRYHGQRGRTQWTQQTTCSCTTRRLVACWAFQMTAFHLSSLCSAATSFVNVVYAVKSMTHIALNGYNLPHISHYDEYSLVELYISPRCDTIYLFLYALNVFSCFLLINLWYCVEGGRSGCCVRGICCVAGCDVTSWLSSIAISHCPRIAVTWGDRMGAVAARGRGQPGHVPRLKRPVPRLCPGGRSGPKLIELTQRLNDKLQ